MRPSLQLGIVGFLVSVLATALLARASTIPPESTSLGAFALPDSSGTEVIALSPVPNPEHIHRLITREGLILEASYARTQRDTGNGSARDATRSFRFMEGAVFRIRGGKIPPDETCFLAADSLLSHAALVPIRRGTRPLDREHPSISKAERLEARSVSNAWQLACAGKDTCVLLLEFEPRGATRLMSIVLWRPETMAMLNEAAEVDEDASSVWRVGDEGRVDPEAFQVEFLLRGPHEVYLATEWSGEEGLSLELLRADNGGGTLQEIYSSYRYLSP